MSAELEDGELRDGQIWRHGEALGPKSAFRLRAHHTGDDWRVEARSLAGEVTTLISSINDEPWIDSGLLIEEGFEIV